jgi:hypothetical protein
MKQRTAIATILVCSAATSAAYALYSVNETGVWPTTWPKELEPLRRTSRTLVGPTVDNRHYQIPFTNREEFEAAWPHLLKVKSKGAPIILIRAPKTDFMDIKPAGVLIHTPPVDRDGKEMKAGEPIPAQANPRVTWMNTNFIELVVDGNIVDLNRIPLPPDTPIIDERFEHNDKKATKAAE